MFSHVLQCEWYIPQENKAMMYDSLKVLLEIQEKDVKMIRLMRLKQERERELDDIQAIKRDFMRQLAYKEEEILELKKNIRLGEIEVNEAGEKVSKLESQQSAVKKVDEFNALSKEIAHAEREKATKEQQLSDLIDELNNEEDALTSLKENLEVTNESSQAYVEEIKESIKSINKEGRDLKSDRDAFLGEADDEMLRVYERLLKNKKDRVVVPIENRTCSGCHIVLTAQHENLVRKGERLVFCEHCSRIHYWPESVELADSAVTTKRRRRRAPAKS